MKTSRKTAGATLVVTVLIVLLMLASIVVVTGQLALSARRGSNDQEATVRAQYVAESGVARAQARVRALGQLLNPTSMTIPATIGSSVMALYALNMCGLATLPTSVVYPLTLCGINPTGTGMVVTSNTPNVFATVPLSDARVALFTQFLSDAQLASVGYVISPTRTKAQFFNDLFKVNGSSVGGNLNSSDAVSANASAKIIGVVSNAADSFKIYMQIPDVISSGTSNGNALRVVKSISDGRVYVLTIGRASFAQWGLFTNHQFKDQNAESAGQPIYFTQNTNYSGPVHTNQIANFYRSTTTNATSPSSTGPTFIGGFGSAGCPQGQIVSTLTSDIDLNTGLAVPIDSCGTTTLNQGANFGYPPVYYSSAAMNSVAGSTSDLPNISTSSGNVQPTFGGNTPKWNDPFIALPPNGNSQIGAAQSGGLYLSGTVASMNLALAPALNLGGVTVKAQTITYVKGGVTTQLAYGADGKMFIKVGSGWQPAAQTPCSPLSTTVGNLACSASGGEWAAVISAAQGKFSGVVYAQDTINNLNGPPRVPSTSTSATAAAPAVADFAQLTVAAGRDINITSDLKYESPPCTGNTVTAPGCTNTSAKNILGIYSAQGDIVIKSPTSDSGGSNNPATPKNVAIQAILMASGGPIAGTSARFGSVRVDGYAQGSGLGNMDLLGGVIENYYGVSGTTGGTGYGQNIIYDVRTSDGVAPPSFPTQKNWQVKIRTSTDTIESSVDTPLQLNGSVTQGRQ